MMAGSMRVYIPVFLGFLCLATCYGNPDDHVLCVESERQALLSFKQGLRDPSNRLSSWAASHLDCCNWTGIVCDILTGHVKELHLSNPVSPFSDYDAFERSMLQGNLSTSFVNLKHLSYMDLSYNDFGRIPIPSFIGSMVSLTYLNLSEAGFEGLIPHNLGNLSRLHHLVIQGPYAGLYNGHSKLYVENLNWLSPLPSLVHLELRSVNLSAASDWLLIINNLPSLLELHLSYCGLLLIPRVSTVNFTSLQILEISLNNFRTPIPKWILSLNNLISLDLSSNNFDGLIPSGFSNLTSLRSLDLSSNSLLSPLPKWLFSLDGLVSLNLGWNNFEGPIPTGLKNMTALRTLDLSDFHSAHNTIPEWLYTFQDLESLHLYSTNLTGEISSAIQNMTSLVTLDLSGNELKGTLPRTLGNLCNLQRISLEYNKLGGDLSKALESISGCLSLSLESLGLGNNNFSGHLPDKIEQLRNLQDLNLVGNLISGPIPKSIEQLGKLQYLELGGNLISGQIPESLGRLSSLIFLSLDHNQFSGTLPRSMGNLSNVQALYISDNKLEGFVTEVHFANLTNLKIFEASRNHLTFKVSPTWVPPFRVYSLDLSYCNLGPQFPMWLQSQDYFSEVDLSCTGISDSIPTWFWNLSSHSDYLNLSHNQIQGELPSNLSIESYIVMMYLGSNQFKGPLPRISAYITELDLSNNSLSGGISRLLCDPINVPNRLKILHLGENQLSGEIPDCWMNWQSLEVVRLGNNNLRGKVPISIGYLHLLQSLHLRNNSLSGEIPVSLGKCKELLTLDLGLNDFVGQIPAWLGTNLPNLKVVGLRSNRISGQIPPEFCHLASLQIVDLANNNLSGSIPKCLNNLTAIVTMKPPSSDSDYRLFYSFYGGVFFEEALVVIKGREFQYDTTLTLLTSLDISGNKLTGKIPEEITALLGLRSLNLSGNHLTGEIPKNIGNMKALESLDLSRNQISGMIPPSMSSLNFLNYLNVSYNKLSGQIPSSTQLQSLNASSFIGNELCGPPLAENCITLPETKNGNGEEGDGNKLDGFYLGMVIGFVVGFWGIFGPLLYSRSWRRTYFLFLSKTWRRLCDRFA